ncbi:MAG: hypothetical protein WC729_08500 [Sphingomonas sp.]|jgi:hypothetical protein|uniref:hypothetical protein n=1 Tax=Sphingomonas sp. TaxID=28214 RepID=UPI0035679271
MSMPFFSRARILALAAIPVAGLVAALSSPAYAATEPRARLVACEAGSCLLVTGYRANTASAVSINGRAVPAEGARKWRVRVPVDTVREWSAPFARTITISVVDAETRTDATAEVDLPIGLLGQVDLAVLVVSAK